MADPTPTCAVCQGGAVRWRVALRPYIVVTFSLDRDYHYDSTIHLHDNCIVEYLDANPSVAIARSVH